MPTFFDLAAFQSIDALHLATSCVTLSFKKTTCSFMAQRLIKEVKPGESNLSQPVARGLFYAVLLESKKRLTFAR